MPISPSSWLDIRKQLHATLGRSQKINEQPVETGWSMQEGCNPEEQYVPFGEVIGQIRHVLLFVTVFGFVINILMLVGPIYMMQVYDRVLSSGSIPTLVFLTLAAGGLLLCSALLEGARSRVLVRLGAEFDELLSAELFARVVSQATRGGLRSSSLRDLDTLRNFLTGQGLFFFFDAPWTPIFLIVIFLIHPLLFVVSLVGAAILFALAFFSEVGTRRPLTEASAHMATATQFAADVVANADTVEAMGMLTGLRQRWRMQWRQALVLQGIASDRAGALSAITKFIRPMLQIAILGVGASLVLRQEMSAGAMVAASIMMGRALAPVEGAIGNWRSFVLARGSYGRIRDLLMSPPRKESKLALPSPDGFVSVERLVGAPPGANRPVISDVSFRLSEGDALGVVGPSGSGKSTLARLIVGAWSPLSGCARLAGVDVAGWKRSELGPHIGYLSQNVELFSGSIADNIARFQTPNAEAIVAASRKAGVHDMILRMPEGYDTPIGIGGNQLSGGQRQRIGLARALYGNPTFVVLDEPNSNLDAQGEEALQLALKELKGRGATVIVVTHRPSLLEAVDKVLVLREGKVEQFGPRQEILWRITRNAAQNDANFADQNIQGNNLAAGQMGIRSV